MKKIIVDQPFTLNVPGVEFENLIHFGPGETVPREHAGHWWVQAQVAEGKAHEDKAEYDEDVAEAKAAKEAEAQAAAEYKVQQQAAAAEQKARDKAAAEAKVAEEAEYKALEEQEAKEKAAASVKAGDTVQKVQSKG